MANVLTLFDRQAAEYIDEGDSSLRRRRLERLRHDAKWKLKRLACVRIISLRN